MQRLLCACTIIEQDGGSGNLSLINVSINSYSNYKLIWNNEIIDLNSNNVLTSEFVVNW